MKKAADFSGAKRGAAVTTVGKTRVTMYLDDDIVAHFKALSERSGKGYQTLINEVLAVHANAAEPQLTPEVVRRIVREELDAHAP
jgi:uncharacterized protein (DUF4415 family)